MQWPQELILVCHPASSDSILEEQMLQDTEYHEFLEAFRVDPENPTARKLAKGIRDRWQVDPKRRTVHLTREDHRKAVAVGATLRKSHGLPDVVYVSPRAESSFQAIRCGWPELVDIPPHYDARIREQSVGLVTSSRAGNWELFCALNPEHWILRVVLGEYWYRFPNGENVPNIRKRIKSWFDDVCRYHSGKRVLAMMSHWNIISLRANLEDWKSEQFLLRDCCEVPVSYGVTIFKKGADGTFAIKDYNEAFY